MNNNHLEIVGRKFNRLTVLSYVGKDKSYCKLYKCKCDCGNIVILYGSNIKNGGTKSCSCLKVEERGKYRTTHGLSNKCPEYNCWRSMKKRCLNKKHKSYCDYGGRGISICDRWVNSFENFLMDMGLRPSLKHSLDRYPDNDGNYEPNNCRWATKREQNENKRDSTILEYEGKRYILVDLAKHLNIGRCKLNGLITNNEIDVKIIQRRKTKTISIEVV